MKALSMILAVILSVSSARAGDTILGCHQAVNQVTNRINDAEMSARISYNLTPEQRLAAEKVMMLLQDVYGKIDQNQNKIAPEEKVRAAFQAIQSEFGLVKCGDKVTKITTKGDKGGCAKIDYSQFLEPVNGKFALTIGTGSKYQTVEFDTKQLAYDLDDFENRKANIRSAVAKAIEPAVERTRKENVGLYELAFEKVFGNSRPSLVGLGPTPICSTDLATYKFGREESVQAKIDRDLKSALQRVLMELTTESKRGATTGASGGQR